MNADTNAAFSYKDAYVELKPHVGGNPITAQQARDAVADLLRQLFKLR